MFAVRGKRDMPGTRVRLDGDGRVGRVGDQPVGGDSELQDAVGTEVSDEDRLPVWRERRAVDMRFVLSDCVGTGGLSMEEGVDGCRSSIFAKREDRQAAAAIVGCQHHVGVDSHVAGVGSLRQLLVQ